MIMRMQLGFRLPFLQRELVEINIAGDDGREIPIAAPSFRMPTKGQGLRDIPQGTITYSQSSCMFLSMFLPDRSFLSSFGLSLEGYEFGMSYVPPMVAIRLTLALSSGDNSDSGMMLP